MDGNGQDPLRLRLALDSRYRTGPLQDLVNKGIMVYLVEGLIVDALHLIRTSGDLQSMTNPEILERPAPRQQSGIRCTSSVCGGGGRGCYES